MGEVDKRSIDEPPKADGPPTMPFSLEEMNRIFDACPNFRIRRGNGAIGEPLRALAEKEQRAKAPEPTFTNVR